MPIPRGNTGVPSRHREGELRDLGCKPHGIRKFIRRSNCRVLRYAAGITGEAAGHLSVQRLRQSCTRRHVGRRSPPRRFKDIGSLRRRVLKRRTGSNRLYLASSVSGKTLAANSEVRLHSVLAALEECRAALTAGGERETALLVSVAILELRMKLNRITAFELKALCDATLPEDAAAERSHDLKSPQGQRRRPLLKLVK
jgi:hypothetical protein